VIAQDTQGRADSLAARLWHNGIEVQRLPARRSAVRRARYGRGPGRPPRAGGLVGGGPRPAAGPAGQALLEPDAVLDSTFIREELESRRTGAAIASTT
jgi:hypothetical protein